MPIRRPTAIAAALAALALCAAGSSALAAGAAKHELRADAAVALHVSDTVRRSLRPRGIRMRRPPARRTSFRLLDHEPTIGEPRLWVGLDTVAGALYPKPFAFRGAGRNIEVWTAFNLDFLPGDCRNGARTQVTDAQVAALIGAFDGVIHPRMSAVFGRPPARDGTRARVGAPFHPQGAGNRVVVLVDNIRDQSFYDLNNEHDFGSAIGIYASVVDDVFDRNVMTIDAFDWLHRSGAQPPHEPSEDNCNDGHAWPHLIEGVFAHEYEHLLERHADPDETDWLDEGLAEWSRTLTGYANPAQSAPALGHDRHVQCFLGNLADATGGPENSLTLWGDGGDANCEYGAVYTFMEYLHGRFDTGLMTALHRGDANGLAGVQQAVGGRGDARELLHDWAAMLALDRVLDNRRGGDDDDDDGGRKLTRFQTPTLDAAIPWDNRYAYAAPGAPPNGADFVRLRDAAGRYLRARDLRSLSFDGASALPGDPVEWVVDVAPPNGGPPALYSGASNGLDRAIVRSVRVPAGGATLTFEAQWNVEEDPTGGWDFTFVQASADGGATYTSLSCTSSRTDASPFARPVMHENLPGYTAYSGGWRSESCDLGAFAGKTILLGFRHVTDGSVAGDPDDPAATIPPGFWVRNVGVAAAPVASGSTLDGWLSPSQARPIAVHGFTVQLVAYSTAKRGKPRVATLPLNAQHDTTLDHGRLRRALGGDAEVVAAIVMYDEPTELVAAAAPYALRANGVLQPGG